MNSFFAQHRSRSLICLVFLFPFLFSCAVPQNNADLIRLRTLKDHAYAGDSESQYQLGLYYTANNKWAWDKARGYGWFLDAAEAGHADAQFMVGMSHLLGQGAKQSDTEAVRWLTNAAKQGHSRGQYQLGKLYLDGTGVDPDVLWGRYWLEQAAWGGHAPAQFMLAAIFSKELAGEKNLPAAWAWLSRAAQAGHSEGKTALQNLTPTLSSAELADGRQLLVKNEKKEADRLYRRSKIRYLQSRLNANGFAAGREDGLAGSQTEEAILRFLQQKKLPPDMTIDQLIAYLRGSG